jgi:hypothetical protein
MFAKCTYHSEREFIWAVNACKRQDREQRKDAADARGRRHGAKRDRSNGAIRHRPQFKDVSHMYDPGEHSRKQRTEVQSNIAIKRE